MIVERLSWLWAVASDLRPLTNGTDRSTFLCYPLNHPPRVHLDPVIDELKSVLIAVPRRRSNRILARVLSSTRVPGPASSFLSFLSSHQSRLPSTAHSYDGLRLQSRQTLYSYPATVTRSSPTRSLSVFRSPFVCLLLLQVEHRPEDGASTRVNAW